MASKTEETPQKEEMLEIEGPETLPESPLLGLSDGAVRELVRSAKKRGYVTHDQINSVLPSEQVNSKQIDDVLAMFSEMGVNVIETDETSKEGEKPREEGEEPREESDEEAESAIAKRIEAGREAMIASLCESPLTFQAIIIWRDELNEGKVFLRDIIDLEATYAGPDAKAMPAPIMGPHGQPLPASSIPGVPPLAQTTAPPAAPPAAIPFKAAPMRPDGEEAEREGVPSGAEFDDEDMENSLSLAAIET